MSNTYKLVELVGSSETGIDDAIQSAVARAAKTLKHLDWFEVGSIRGEIENGAIKYYQVTMKVGFRVMDPEDLKD